MPKVVAPVAVEYELTSQLVHAAEPVDVLYFPATHSTQVCPSSPVAPALQVQAVSTADPASEFEFAGQTSQVGLPSADHEPAEHCWHVSAPVVEYLPAPQLMHVLTKVAPVAVEYVPALQSVHAAEPDPGLYLPAGHETHVCPSSPVDPGLHLQSERNAEA